MGAQTNVWPTSHVYCRLQIDLQAAQLVCFIIAVSVVGGLNEAILVYGDGCIFVSITKT